MTLQETIKGSLKEAMMAKDTVRMTVIRGLMSAFTNELVAIGRTPQDSLTDDEVLTVIRRGVKQRKDAIEQFTTGGRPDLAESEAAELKILEVYLPQMMSREEIKTFAEAKKAELGVTDKTKVGILMSALMKDLKGKADGSDVKAVVESLF
ncbi:MAG: GatB/YqeY domain-containing protein [Candidatus Taylorbacteria bacterium]|nr:GatB/YqeY domain-containing protein [Candidatus Taylorbacteria bacterium]